MYLCITAAVRSEWGTSCVMSVCAVAEAVMPPLRVGLLGCGAINPRPV